MTTRRQLLLGGCALTALLAAPTSAEAGLGRARAPRLGCKHRYCRHHRPASDGEGICALALRGPVVGPDEEVIP